MEKEIWKEIPGYEGVYYVSNIGRVKKIYKSGKEKILSITPDEYHKVQLWKNGSYKTFRVHILVWEAFNGPIPEGMQINHINENKYDNRLENLNLMTPKENINWGTAIQRRVEKHKIAVNQYDMEGYYLYTWPEIKEAAAALNISRGHITEVCQGKRKSIGGYRWEYA
jgi:hypothetical protein